MIEDEYGLEWRKLKAELIYECLLLSCTFLGRHFDCIGLRNPNLSGNKEIEATF